MFASKRCRGMREERVTDPADVPDAEASVAGVDAAAASCIAGTVGYVRTTTSATADGTRDEPVRASPAPPAGFGASLRRDYSTAASARPAAAKSGWYADRESMARVPTGSARSASAADGSVGVIDLAAGRYPGFLFGLPVGAPPSGLSLPRIDRRIARTGAPLPRRERLPRRSSRTSSRASSATAVILVRRRVMLASTTRSRACGWWSAPLLQRYGLRAVTYAIPGRIAEAPRPCGRRSTTARSTRGGRSRRQSVRDLARAARRSRTAAASTCSRTPGRTSMMFAGDDADRRRDARLRRASTS